MISSLLQNRGLRLQLLVALLLVLGTFPEPSDGLTCYHCENVLASQCTETKTCAPEEGYCISEVTATSEIKGVNKGCLESKRAECFKKKRFGGSSCKKITDWNAAGDFQEKTYRSCSSEMRVQKERKKEQTFEYLSICVCDSDLCNSDNSGESGESGAGRGDSGGSGRPSSSILHPFKSIIITILTVALYNYT